MSALIPMPVLPDRDEDDQPAYRIPSMSDQDTRNTETLAPETDREAPTNPDNPLPHRNADPPPPNMQDSLFAVACQTLSDEARAMREDRETRRRFELQTLDLQNSILDAVQKADANQSANFGLIRVEIGHLKDSDLKQDQRLKEGDSRFDQIELSIAGLNELVASVSRKIEALEHQIAEARANARTSATPPAQQA